MAVERVSEGEEVHGDGAVMASDMDCNPVPMELASEASDSESETDTESESESESESETTSDTCTSDNNPASCGTPLYIIPSSDQVYTSRISVEQHLLAVCAYASKYNISRQQFKDLIFMINLHLPENNLCELNIKKIKQQCGYSSDKTMVHEYCSKCGALKEEDDIQICWTANCGNRFDNAKSNGSFFVSANIKFQMKNILERESNWEKIQECHSRVRTDIITDITDGHEYRKLRKKGEFLSLPSNNITFTFFY